MSVHFEPGNLTGWGSEGVKMRADADDACDCTRGLFKHNKRVCKKTKNPLPHRGLEPASDYAWLFVPPLCPLSCSSPLVLSYR